MSKYFSNLAKRTGIGAQGALGVRPLAFRREGLGHKGEQAHSGLEVHVRKTVKQPLSKPNYASEDRPTKGTNASLQQSSFQKDAESSPVSNPPVEVSTFAVKVDSPQSLPNDSSESVSSENSAAIQPKGAVKNDHKHVSYTENVKQQGPHVADMPQAATKSHKVVDDLSVIKSGEADAALHNEKQRDGLDHQHQTISQKHLDKSEVTSTSESQVFTPQLLREEKIITVESARSELVHVKDSSSFSRTQQPETKEPAYSPHSLIDTSEKTLPPRSSRRLYHVSKRRQEAETQSEKEVTATQDNSVDIHIGTISFEVHQAPQEKTVTVPPAPPAPRPVVIQQSQPSQTPRLSRYYLRGV